MIGVLFTSYDHTCLTICIALRTLIIFSMVNAYKLGIWSKSEVFTFYCNVLHYIYQTLFNKCWHTLHFQSFFLWPCVYSYISNKLSDTDSGFVDILLHIQHYIYQTHGFVDILNFTLRDLSVFILVSVWSHQN